MKKSLFALGTVLALLLHLQVVWSQDTTPAPAAGEKKAEPKPEEPKAEEKKAEAPPAKPDPTGASTGDKTILGDDPRLPKIEATDKDPRDEAHNKNVEYLNTVADAVGKNRAGINMMWTLLTGFLVMFMQAGFAMVETGLTRAKNVSHTMAMNLMIYAIGMLGFWVAGFAFMFGGYGAVSLMGGANLLDAEWTVKLFGGKEFGLIGYKGFFLAGQAFDTTVMTLFLFQMVFMDTTATIPTGTLAERWKFVAFCVYGVCISVIIYPVYGNWVWGGGWLSKLGANFGLGHGHVDFAGSSVVHMVGGITALAGALILGPRIGKYNPDGTPNALPAHNVPMYVVGTFILAFGWFGFNPGSTNAGADLNIGRIAANTMLASGAGAVAAMIVMWRVFKKPDPSFMCNGLLAGLVAITAPCAFVTPWAAVLIGLVAGVLVVGAAFFIERKMRVDDPVGAISVHGANGLWGVLALGLFADGTYGQGLNSTFLYRFADGHIEHFAEKPTNLPPGTTEMGVTGLFYGNAPQFFAECIGVMANIVWVFCAAYACFWVIEKLIGNRVAPEVELQGLDVPEMGVLGYINEDPKTPEGHVVHASAEPRHADVPPNGKQGYTLVVEGMEPGHMMSAWNELCQPSQAAPPDFRSIYPYMTTVKGGRFRFRGGDPQYVRSSLERLLRAHPKGTAATVRVER